MRRKSKFVSRFNADSAVQSSAQKYSDSVFRKNMIVSCHPASARGTYARSSRHVRRGCDGRVGLARRAMPMRTAKSCGPGAPTLAPSRVVTSRAMTGARKPGSPGRSRISVKTIAQGMPDDPAEPVVTAACVFCLQAGHWGRPPPGIPCALPIRRGRQCDNSGAIAPRERGLTSLACLKDRPDAQRRAALAADARQSSIRIGRWRTRLPMAS
jgi:hypothetical protein